jgi:hypothetical protein
MKKRMNKKRLRDGVLATIYRRVQEPGLVEVQVSKAVMKLLGYKTPERARRHGFELNETFPGLVVVFVFEDDLSVNAFDDAGLEWMSTVVGRWHELEASVRNAGSPV